MREKTLNAVIGGLFYHIGKIKKRGEECLADSCGKAGREYLEGFFSEDILQCVGDYHNGQPLVSEEEMTEEACAVFCADEIVALADGQQPGNATENNPHLPLFSIFNLVNGNQKKWCYGTAELKESLPDIEIYDHQEIKSEDYRKLAADLREDMRDILCTYGMDVGALTECLERKLSYIPSSTNTLEEAGISFFDHARMTAAVAACIMEYLEGSQIGNYYDFLIRSKKNFWNTEVFLLASFDFSGIQKFIYQVPSKGALKGLRSRSFFLEILMEHIVEEFLEWCGLSGIHLLYSGGGHSYVLLPNTESIREKFQQYEGKVNQWFIESFGISLYLAVGMEPCSPKRVFKLGDEEEDGYTELFRKLSGQLSDKKLRRYNKKQIMYLNRENLNPLRECKICGRSDLLEKEEDICRWCSAFIKNANVMIEENSRIVVSSKRKEQYPYFELVGAEEKRYMYVFQENMHDRELEEDYRVRSYRKNWRNAGEKISRNLYMGDYVSSKYLGELSKVSRGIRRIAVFRGDVDNLGATFIKGFSNKHAGLSRSAALSRSLSLFYKYYINGILKGISGVYCMPGDCSETEKKVMIVYSGGDDVFLAGAWDDVLETSIMIRRQFERFSCGTLTLSGGIGLYNSKYPLIRAAGETGELEECAKSLDGKAAAALFTPKEHHIYKWSVLEKQVIEEKLCCISSFFDNTSESGRALAYHMLMFLRKADDKINIARYAYLLSRMEKLTENFQQKNFKEFSGRMYKWALDKKEREQLITAMYIWIYLTRRAEA